MSKRVEHDSLGEIQVEEDKYWGAQTQRSLMNFPIGIEKMPQKLIMAYALLKKACAMVNADCGKLDKLREKSIIAACNEIQDGLLKDHFPLSVWQTGSGTQTNMNLNEVISHRANEILGSKLKENPKLAIHPNDHVNMSQSSNDTFPSVIHIMAVLEVCRELEPAIKGLRDALKVKSNEFMPLIKIGRTHLQDATPLTLGQEFSGYVAMLETNLRQISDATTFCRQLAIGGTAVGTGLNAPKDFGMMVCKTLTEITKESFTSETNKFHALSSKDAIVFLSGALKSLASNLMKMANDIRWLASGPRSGLGEINLPANEPGSSIMPGKVNPTQCEALTMVCTQVMGNDCTIGIAASQGNFELNAYMPVIAYNLDQSIRLLSDSIQSFTERCVKGITANQEKLKNYMESSLMLVTALAPLVGYENAAKIAKKAYSENKSLKEVATELKLCTPEQFDQYVDPSKMI